MTNPLQELIALLGLKTVTRGVDGRGIEYVSVELLESEGLFAAARLPDGRFQVALAEGEELDVTREDIESLRDGLNELLAL